MCVGAIIGVWRRSEDSLVESALSSCLPWFSAVQLRSSGLKGELLPTVLSGPGAYIFLTVSFIIPSDLLQFFMIVRLPAGTF